MLYALVRAAGEMLREPDASLLFGLSRGTFYSLFLIIGGLILLGMSLSAVGQSVPPRVEMKGFKMYHLEGGQKAAH